MGRYMAEASIKRADVQCFIQISSAETIHLVDKTQKPHTLLDRIVCRISATYDLKYLLDCDFKADYS